MTPQPFPVTGNPKADWVIFVVGLLVAVYWLRALRLARQGARRLLRNLLKSFIIFCLSAVALTAVVNMQASQSRGLSFFVAFGFFVVWQGQKRSRYISRSTKRSVIERDLKGQMFDSQKHHIDHIWPFARGGSHTTDNLRVISKKKNLKKGARRPGLRDMW